MLQHMMRAKPVVGGGGTSTSSAGCEWTLEALKVLGQKLETVDVRGVEQAWANASPLAKQQWVELVDKLQQPHAALPGVAQLVADSAKSSGRIRHWAAFVVAQSHASFTMASGQGAESTAASTSTAVSVRAPVPGSSRDLFQHESTYAPVPRNEGTQPRDERPVILVLKPHHRDALASRDELLPDELVDWAVDVCAASPHARRDAAPCPTDDLSKHNGEKHSFHARRIKGARKPTRLWVAVCHQASHYVVMVLDTHSRKVFSLDSLRGKAEASTVERECYKCIAQGLQQQFKDVKEPWPLVPVKCAQQQDWFNCGVFAFAFADALFRSPPNADVSEVDFTNLPKSGAELRQLLLASFDMEHATYVASLGRSHTDSQGEIAGDGKRQRLDL